MKLQTKTMLMGAALAALTAAPAAAAGMMPVEGDAAKGECHGVNACKGQGDCGGKGRSCAGTNECKGQGWKSMTEAECEEAGGKFKGGKEAK